MSQVVNNLRAAFQKLTSDVDRALLTRVGNQEQLSIVWNEVLRFYEAAEINKEAFSAVEWSTISQAIKDMVAYLDAAALASADPPEALPLAAAQRVMTGRKGRPRVEIHREVLIEGSLHRSNEAIGEVVGCSARTVRRRKLEQGLAAPALPVFEEQVDENGDIVLHRNPPPRREQTLTDEELDFLVQEILTRFPNFGQSMINGALRSASIYVTRERLVASYIRVHGAPRPFGDNTITRRKYSVAGANSLWHHDGQHGLIKYKFVIHCFIDGLSRFITGIRVNTNNRAATVLDLFLDAISKHGCPSRARGDHGTENLLVAAWMEEHQGPDRGSYIFGRSVHNTRIERLWVDVTQGFGKKWKEFFLDLEMQCGLDPQDPMHIWLLHHLFLDALNRDATVWAEAWNSHIMKIDGQPNRSPRDMFFFSMMENGPRGMQYLLDEHIEDLANYGVDWEDADNPQIMQHLLANNPHEADDRARAARNLPPRMNEVVCEAPPAPMLPPLVQILDQALLTRVNLQSDDMGVRQIVWMEALNIFVHLLGHAQFILP
ncbi:hypothetical protein CVT26_001047 [Gymnopilus dilepis]|uniref:Integrase core domain-containing protein n=1 Tax=Gymnopilus dilepis TaxID=231916 RepID=A0A409Y268_9AGAR|nr:hypothetical protein CVT26_001047 [Gymnopilus dilepis]